MMKESELLQLHAKSVFAPYMIDFIEQKRALGFKYNTCVEVLNMFDAFCRENGVTETILSKELFEKWCRKKANENKTTLMMRINYVQIFSKHLHNNGIDAPASFHPLPKKSKAFIAYIFSEEEILRFIQTVDLYNTKPSIGSPVKRLVHPVLFRVLYGCGLRINEALKLKVGDVDLKNGTMLIRAAKGDKDRMVVLSDSLAKICTEYRSHNAIRSFESECFSHAPIMDITIRVQYMGISENICC